MTNKIDFVVWLEDILITKNLTASELAKRAHIDKGIISRVLNRERKPSTETLAAIANALKIPTEEVFRKAGILPEKPEIDPLMEDLLYTLSRLPQEDQDELLELAKFKLQRQSRTKTTLNNHPKPAQT